MRQRMRDDRLAGDISAQLTLISDAYATGVASEIDHALARVVEIRRMEKTGLQDLLEDWSAPDDAE
ncbi:hypothetical protein J3R80_13700 [Aliiroseovarius sp. Z3]|uniref:hypothetical protein n=1 Tax=Aliiroseovarius sp. Z3 TaxID=2811402 RepID=UPI0023B21744|nr:hypothetical protein [Aliiroseovarius sp. Z3]MDE9451523.1 hypothetical protein [Aliiroseovarius sp. Z3]